MNNRVAEETFLEAARRFTLRLFCVGRADANSAKLRLRVAKTRRLVVADGIASLNSATDIHTYRGEEFRSEDLG